MDEKASTKLEWARTASRFAWPAAFIVVAAMGFSFARDRARPSSSEVVVHGSNTVVKSLHDLARLETTSLHMEKVIDVRDEQKKLGGLVETEDSLLFIATGETVVGVDLGRLREGDARFDEATKTAYVTLTEPEVLSTRFDEMHSYVHSRNTGTLATRNEQLESTARKQAIAAFEAAGREKSVTDRARAQAERDLKSLARAWGANDVVVTWRPVVAGENPSR